MEDRIAGHSPAEAIAGVAAPVAWRDLRDWLDLVEANGLLKHIASPVEPDEELGAITLLATRREDAPALLFEQLAGDRSQARILCNMLGASKERYALAVGIDPGLSIAGMIAATRGVMKRRIAPVRVAKRDAPVNEIVLTGDQIDLTAFPVPKFWPGDGGRYIGTGDITLTSSADSGRLNVGVYRQMLHGPSRIGLYCSPGKHGLLDREGWWARGKPCEVVAAYGIDPVLFMLGAQAFGACSIRARRRRRDDGASGGIDRGRVCQPADPGPRGIRGRRPAASGRPRARRPARRVHGILRTRAFAAAGHRGEGGAPSAVADLTRAAQLPVWVGSVIRDRAMNRLIKPLAISSTAPAARKMFSTRCGFGTSKRCDWGLNSSSRLNSPSKNRGG